MVVIPGKDAVVAITADTGNMIERAENRPAS